MEEQKQMPEQKADSTDVEKNKALAIVGYIIPILFFIPLVTDAKNSPYAKFHANQQLNLLLFWVGYACFAILMFLILGFFFIFLVMTWRNNLYDYGNY